MKLPSSFVFIFILFATTLAPSCRCSPKQVKDTTTTVAKTKAGQSIIQKLKGFFVKTKPTPPQPPINPMPIIATAKVFFKVVDAAGKEVYVNNPALQLELSASQIIDEPRLIQIAQKVFAKIYFREAFNKRELTSEQKLLAFQEVIKEIKASKGLYSFAFGTVFYRKRCDTNPNYYIIASKEV